MGICLNRHHKGLVWPIDSGLSQQGDIAVGYRFAPAPVTSALWVSVMNDESEILKIHDDWIGLEESGKEEGVLKFCCKDVVWLVPGLGELQGVEEVRSYLMGQPETVIVSIDTSNVAVEVSNGLAVKRARFCTTFMNGDIEAKITGTHIWTLRKNRQAGQWQVTCIAWVIDAGSS